MRYLYRFMELILSPACLVCGASAQRGTDLCLECGDLLTWNWPACPRCALPVEHGFQGICGHCIKKPPAYDASLSFWRYQAPLDGLLLGLKYHRQLPVARLLGRLMTEHISNTSIVMPQALVPVPLHVSRLRQRGFNQSIELFLPVARAMGIPLLREVVIRHRATSSQVGLSRSQRRRNLRGAFVVRESLPEHVAIVDDVVTTGTTVNELARVLRRAGVERIDVWSVARADEPHSTR
jgi:ComF family protein